MRCLVGALFALAAVTVTSAGDAHAGRTVDIRSDLGGVIVQYDTRWQTRAKRGDRVRISGTCASACTILLHHIPRDRICVEPGGRLGFHLSNAFGGTDYMMRGYPDDIKAWIKAAGGLTTGIKWLAAPAIFRYFRRC